MALEKNKIPTGAICGDGMCPYVLCKDFPKCGHDVGTVATAVAMGDTGSNPVRPINSSADSERTKKLKLSPRKSVQPHLPSVPENSVGARQSNLIDRIRRRVVDTMYTDYGGYDKTAEDIRKMLIAFDRGD